MRKRRVLAVLAALLLAFAIAKESREPHLWLFIDDWFHPKPLPVTLALHDGLAVRLYGDTRPHNAKVARLQKGLVLVVDGRERIEEGFGFGLPLIHVGQQAYLTRSATVERIGNTLVKRYLMDTLETPSGFLRRKYTPASPIGTVVVSYTPQGEAIDVSVDLSGLDVAWTEAYLMNEQGARFFTRYEEPGMVVEGEAFGIWQQTTARRGCIVAEDGSVRFCVETDEASPRHYGRERYNQYYWVGIYVLSWAGIDLELAAPLARFHYRVVVERLSRD